MLDRRELIKAAGVLAAGSALGAPLTGCLSAPGSAGEHTVFDSVGREVTLPAVNRMSKIYFTSPLAQVFCFTLAPDLLAGTSIQFTKEELALLPEGTGQLPYLGSLSSGGSIDTEALDYLGVQAVFSISGVDLTDVNVDDAVRLQAQTGIPAVLIDGSFDVIGDSYRFLGECLGRQERAEDLANYCQDIYERVTSAVSLVPESERVTYYFAEGEEGLYTEPNASQHSVAFTTAGGINVAADLDYQVGSQVRTPVDIAQIQQWDPQFIIAWNYENKNSAAAVIRYGRSWKDIDAVRSGRVYEMPHLPFAFCDRPPGMNRFLGIQWLAHLFYPDYYDVDMVQVVREFCSRCYWRDISRAQAIEILGDSYGKAGL